MDLAAGPVVSISQNAAERDHNRAVSVLLAPAQVALDRMLAEAIKGVVADSDLTGGVLTSLSRGVQAVSNTSRLGEAQTPFEATHKFTVCHGILWQEVPDPLPIAWACTAAEPRLFSKW
jgi:hypothetical protein